MILAILSDLVQITAAEDEEIWTKYPAMLRMQTIQKVDRKLAKLNSCPMELSQWGER